MHYGTHSENKENQNEYRLVGNLSIFTISVHSAFDSLLFIVYFFPSIQFPLNFFIEKFTYVSFTFNTKNTYFFSYRITIKLSLISDSHSFLIKFFVFESMCLYEWAVLIPLNWNGGISIIKIWDEEIFVEKYDVNVKFEFQSCSLRTGTSDV